MSKNASLTISDDLFNQLQFLAQELNLSPDDLVEIALENFIKSHRKTAENNRVIHQGDIYWVELASGIPHPQVVIQPDLFNQSRLQTVVVCGLTSNLGRINLLGNLLLEAGEANLPKPSVVEVSKVSTVDKAQLTQYIGTLSEQRVNQILAGMRFLQDSFFTR